MSKKKPPHPAGKLEFHALTPERWPDLELPFGARGACGGCWCMAWRRTRAEFDRQKGEGNKRAFRRIVKSGAEPGVLAYAEGQPVGWCAVAPRSQYPFLERSRILAPVDDQPVWSVSCFFVAKGWRKHGLSVALIEAATQLARQRGAEIVEGYPHELKADLPAAFAWTGVASAFRKVGFTVAARRSSRGLSCGFSRLTNHQRPPTVAARLRPLPCTPRTPCAWRWRSRRLCSSSPPRG